jgi:hypothetical protein
MQQGPSKQQAQRIDIEYKSALATPIVIRSFYTSVQGGSIPAPLLLGGIKGARRGEAGHFYD